MADSPTPERVTFINPVLRARLGMTRALRLMDDLERAAARDDYWSVQEYARRIQTVLDDVQSDTYEAVQDMERASAVLAALVADPTDDHEAVADALALFDAEPPTIQRALDGDR